MKNSPDAVQNALQPKVSHNILISDNTAPSGSSNIPMLSIKDSASLKSA